MIRLTINGRFLKEVWLIHWPNSPILARFKRLPSSQRTFRLQARLSHRASCAKRLYQLHFSLIIALWVVPNFLYAIWLVELSSYLSEQVFVGLHLASRWECWLHLSQSCLHHCSYVLQVVPLHHVEEWDRCQTDWASLISHATTAYVYFASFCFSQWSEPLLLLSCGLLQSQYCYGLLSSLGLPSTFPSASLDSAAVFFYDTFAWCTTSDSGSCRK